MLGLTVNVIIIGYFAVKGIKAIQQYVKAKQEGSPDVEEKQET